MKKAILLFTLLCGMFAAVAQEPPPAVKEKPKSSSTAIWIGLGVVLFVTIIAANKRRRRNQ